MRELYLLYRWYEHNDIHGRCTDDGWKLVGIVKDMDHLKQIEEIDRKSFGENADLEYSMELVYTDL